MFTAKIPLYISLYRMDEVPRAFAISDIQSSPAGDERSSVYQKCVKSSMTYGSETMPLVVDVGLMFERALCKLLDRWVVSP